MTHLQKLRIHHVLKWGSVGLWQNYLNSYKPFICDAVKFSFRFYATKRVHMSKKDSQILLDTTAQAQTALLEYLHSTRSLQFLDAENMSKNSPIFLDKLLKGIDTTDDSTDIKRKVTRFLRYHPINEFELFFESLGLKPMEFASLLPRHMTFLSDNTLLLENYQILCDYGIERCKIGKIYKEAIGIFRYDYGALKSKIRAYEALGFRQSFLVKVISSSPIVLIGDINSSFMEVIERLNILGFDCQWTESHLKDNGSVNWRQILEVLSLFTRLGFTEEQIVNLINKNPKCLFEGSGKVTFSLFGLLLKFGSNKQELLSAFFEIPECEVVQFVYNLRQTIVIFNDIGMEPKHFGRIVRSYPALLGECSLKKCNSLRRYLKAGKKRICNTIIENPQVIKNWGLGANIQPLSPDVAKVKSLPQEKIKFLLDLGFVEDSNEMKRALKIFRGKGEELQERFNCLVKAGLDIEDVVEIVKTTPQLLNQSKDLIEMKLDYLLNGLKLPISDLKLFPGYLSYKIERVKLRIAMYSWLRYQGMITRPLALGTLIASSDKRFKQTYVEQYPKGPEVWQKLREKILSG